MRWEGKDAYEKRKASGLCVHCSNKARPSRVTCERCAHQISVTNKKHRIKIGDSRRAQERGWRNKAKEEALAAYGGKCVCCGESHSPYLTIDHVNDDGGAHRREVGAGSLTIHLWLRRNGYPKGFQILCANCHLAKSWKRPCPEGHAPNWEVKRWL